jgi:hypothetical protein
MHKCIISITKREVVLALKTSFTQLHFVEMPVPSQASEQSYIHVYRGIDLASFSTIFGVNFGALLMVWYFSFFYS